MENLGREFANHPRVKNTMDNPVDVDAEATDLETRKDAKLNIRSDVEQEKEAKVNLRVKLKIPSRDGALKTANGKKPFFTI
ncbi:hypothetical protein L6452_06220 [Arctium lappa]|uniref:Uncharacterized protein n=1 Tax=Arctium lappa TaxID=4217 RepID=A0ACB9EJM2_ARCLA|nr:hypothetical protein L6452_06220 [Arctium lappa]